MFSEIFHNNKNMWNNILCEYMLTLKCEEMKVKR